MAEKVVMVGGARFQQAALDWTQQSSHLFTAVFGSALVLWAVFAEKLPVEWRWQLNTMIGRMLLLLLLVIIYNIGGWLPALLFTIATALTWANRPLAKPTSVKEEGFADVKTVEVESDRWFVEKTLEERPKKIVEDRVDTYAVQDDSQSGNSRTSK
jgi:hypothetical protein